MKTIIALTIVLLSASSSFAQTQEPTPAPSKGGKCKVHIETESAIFNPYSTGDYYDNQFLEDEASAHALRVLCAEEVPANEEADADIKIKIQYGMSYKDGSTFPSYVTVIVNGIEDQRMIRPRDLQVMKMVRKSLNQSNPCNK